MRLMTREAVCKRHVEAEGRDSIRVLLACSKVVVPAPRILIKPAAVKYETPAGG